MCNLDWSSSHIRKGKKKNRKINFNNLIYLTQDIKNITLTHYKHLKLINELFYIVAFSFLYQIFQIQGVFYMYGISHLGFYIFIGNIAIAMLCSVMSNSLQPHG